MKKIWGKRIGTGVLAISLMLSSLPTQLSIALPHKAKAADTEFKSEAFDYGKLPDSTAAKITRKSLTGKEWTGEDNNLDITSVDTLPDSSQFGSVCRYCICICRCQRLCKRQVVVLPVTYRRGTGLGF